MSRRCILHIGPYKTGSSSLQATLRTYRREFRQRGLFTLEKAPPAHGYLRRYALDDDNVDNQRQMHRETTPEAIGAWRAELQENLAETVENMGDGDLLVLSDEGLSYPLNDAERKRMLDLVTPHFDQIQVVAYLRPQVERMVSAYSQALRNGATHENILRQGSAMEMYDYSEMLANWAETFGDNRIEPRIYQNDTLVDGDVVADFFAIAKVEYKDLEPLHRRNPSLSADAQRLLRQLNTHIPKLIDGQQNPQRGVLESCLVNLFPGDGILPGRADAEAFSQQFDASNEAVRERWFPFRERLFDISFDRYPQTQSTEELNAEQVLEMCSELWKERTVRVNSIKKQMSSLKQTTNEQRRTIAEMKRKITKLRGRNEELKSAAGENRGGGGNAGGGGGGKKNKKRGGKGAGAGQNN